MPPPSILRSRRTRATNASSPATMEPIGAPSPLDRQNCTESACSATAAGDTPMAAAALNSRAPSRCTGTPRSSAKRRTSRA